MKKAGFFLSVVIVSLLCVACGHHDDSIPVDPQPIAPQTAPLPSANSSVSQ